jgi:hypothetical protein
VPDDLAEALFAAITEMDAQRGDWPQASLDAGMAPRSVMIQLAAHAWFEDGIENYDRGQRDTRRPRAV